MFGGQWSSQEELLDRFLDAAARGDQALVSSFLSNSPSLLNKTGQNGWSALMFASRNGHDVLVRALLQHGCDKSLLNRSSQSAFDVAKFWGHTHICRLLLNTGPGPDLDQNQKIPEPQNPHETFFSAEPLDRLSAKRPDRDWIRTRLQDPRTVFILLHRLSPMVRYLDQDQDQEREAESRLCLFSPDQIQDLLQRPDCLLLFLGVDRRGPPRSTERPQTEGWEPRAWFALSSDCDQEQLLKLSKDKLSHFTKNHHRELLQLNEEDAGIVAQARSLAAWHSRYSHCSTCGSVSRVEEAGHKRSCETQACVSHKGVHNTCYPRVDPVVIMLVIHPDQSQVLLGRKKVFPPGMFSCLAGFIEPGECVEAAVRREVQEESGVQVGPVWYVCSQPWPMPSSLMIGCFTVAMTTEIKVDQDEIEEAQWFTRQQVVDSLLSGPRVAFTVPPRQTIAHQLLRHWSGLSSQL